MSQTVFLALMQGYAKMTVTIQEAIDTIIAAIPGSPFPETVDTIKLGNPSQPVTGIITTFLATHEVIEKAVHLNANLIIAHEPIFYNHLDKTDWLHNDPVYNAKRAFVEANGLVVWRFHDYMHSLKPDPVFVGMLQTLAWESYFQPQQRVCQIPPLKLSELVNHVKTKLNIQTLRAVGNLDMTCQTVALLPGFPPAAFHIEALGQSEIDVLICGEIHEWETSEYVRDAIRLRHNKALIVTGHAASEEPGMRGIIPWLQERLPGVSIHFVPTGNPFQYL
jgi:putative NIF3 family GTP cyclohydrolase 1 type 2